MDFLTTAGHLPNAKLETEMNRGREEKKRNSRNSIFLIDGMAWAARRQQIDLTF